VFVDSSGQAFGSIKVLTDGFLWTLSDRFQVVDQFGLVQTGVVFFLESLGRFVPRGLPEVGSEELFRFTGQVGLDSVQPCFFGHSPDPEDYLFDVFQPRQHMFAGEGG
jgi:hypothetical protein